MRAILCHGWGGPEDLTLGEAPPPPITPDGVRIAARATGVNFADTLMIRGQYQRKPDFPFSPGLETAGVVTEVGAAVTRLKPGDRVVSALMWGGFAEEVVAEERFTFKIPDEMGFEDAVNFAVAYPTAHGALLWQGRLAAGETALIHGAAGGVGLAGVEIAKAMGATVIATAGTDAKGALARDHGADHAINTTTENFRDRVLEITGGRGADMVLELIGGEVFDATLRCAAWNARIVSVGFASGSIPQAPCNILLVKNIGVLGFALSTYRKNRFDLADASMTQLFDWWRAGKLKPVIDRRMDFARAAEALNLLIDRKVTGKLVLTFGGGD